MNAAGAATAVVLACSITFCLYWPVSAFVVKKTAHRESIRSRFAYRVVQLVGILLLIYDAMPGTSAVGRLDRPLSLQ